MANIFTSTQEVINDVLKQQERIILDQLGELIDRGLLEFQSTQPVITSEYDYTTNKTILNLSQYGKLVLKDQEYIEKLEKENKELKTKINNLNTSIKDLSDTIYFNDGMDG